MALERLLNSNGCQRALEGPNTPTKALKHAQKNLVHDLQCDPFGQLFKACIDIFGPNRSNFKNYWWVLAHFILATNSSFHLLPKFSFRCVSVAETEKRRSVVDVFRFVDVELVIELEGRETTDGLSPSLTSLQNLRHQPLEN